MLNEKRILYSYNDVAIEPAVISHITSRSQCNPYLKDGMLPIFASPMSTVVNEQNYDIFLENKITPILPRNIDLNVRLNYAVNGKWAAFSLNEFEKYFASKTKKQTIDGDKMRVLIDVANGHMSAIYDLVRESKNIYGHTIEIMVGNIANPITYIECLVAGVDYVRASIGTGSCCITSSQTAVHYPMASLLNDIFVVKEQIKKNADQYMRKDEVYTDFLNRMPKVIADGGIRNYCDVIKALALGADYVMIGSVFTALVESAGTMTAICKNDGSRYVYDNWTEGIIAYNISNADNFVWVKEMYGMASKEGQIAINGKKTKTSEGIKKEIAVTGTIPQWAENMTAYLRSAMSYTDCVSIYAFTPIYVTCHVISQATTNSINK